MSEPIKYPDGSSYVGNMKDGRKHGLGIYRLPEGSEFVGQFVNGVVDGYGKIEWLAEGETVQQRGHGAGPGL